MVGNVSFFAGGDDTRSFDHRESRLRWVGEQTIRAYDNLLDDVELLHQAGRFTAEERDRLQREGRRLRAVYAVEKEMMDGSVFKRMSTLAGAARRGNFKCALRFLPRLLPPKIYRALYQIGKKYPSSGWAGVSAGVSS